MRSAHPQRLPAKNVRPPLEVPRSSLERAAEAIALLGAVLTVTLPAYFWNRLPDRVPVHFGPSDQPDAWGPKAWIWLVSAASILLDLGLSLAARVPHRLPLTVGAIGGILGLYFIKVIGSTELKCRNSS